MGDSERRMILTGAMEPIRVLGDTKPDARVAAPVIPGQRVDEAPSPLAAWEHDEIRPASGLVEVLVVGLPTLFREGVRGILEDEQDLLVIAEVNYAEAVAVLTTTPRTPVVLVDIDGLGTEPLAMIHRI